MKITVLGGAGFIGSNLVSFLKNKGHYVKAVDIHFPKEREDAWGKADEILELDLRNQESVNLALLGSEYVFNLAANMGGVLFFHNHDYYPFMDNMTIDMNVLRECEKLKIKRLFFSSSACIYPTHLQMSEGNAPKLSEDMIFPARSDQMYGYEKLMTTMLCERAPFDARVGIFHTIYGQYQEIEGERMKAPTALATKAIKSLETGTFEIWGNGKQIRSFLYIDDAIEKIYEVMMSDSYHDAVNIASDEAVTMQEVAQICCDIVGSKPKFTYTTDKPSGVLARNADNTKYNKHYSYRNQYSTYAGFKKLITWIQSLDKQ